MTTPQIITVTLLATSLGLVSLWRGSRDVVPSDVETLALAAQPASEPARSAPRSPVRAGVRAALAEPGATPRRAADEQSRAEPAARAETLVHLRVVHEQDGRPAVGTCVLVSTTDDGLPYAAETAVLTDADGRAELAGITPGWVRARLLTGSQAHARLEPGGALDVDLSLPLGIGVDGEVVDAEGQPVPGAEVWVSERWMREAGQVVARADAHGRFVLDGLTADNFVGARSAAHAPSRLHVLHGAPGERLLLRLALSEPGYALAGVVVDELGRPLAGVEVEVGGGGSPWRSADGLTSPAAPPQRVRTAGDGRFAFDAVAAGDVRVAARAPGRSAGVTVAALDRRGRDDVVLELAPEAVVVGTLRDHAGAPVPFASIRSGPHNRFAVSATTTRVDGGFRLAGLAAGEVELVAEHADSGRTHATLTLQGGEERRWDPLLPAVPTILGTVTDEDGEPLAGWSVVAHHHALDASEWRFGPTRDDGTFRIAGLAAGESYTLLVNEPVGRRVFPRRLVRDVVASSRPYAVVVRGSDPELASIAGAVVDARGAPVANAQVCVWHEELRLWRAIDLDREGAIAIADVPPGSLRLELRSREHPWLRLGRHTLAAGERLDLGTRTLALGGRIEGRLEGADDDALTSVACTLFDPLTGREAGSIVREGRAFQSGPLAPGVYTLRIVGPGLATVERRVAIRAGLSEELSIRLTPGRPARD